MLPESCRFEDSGASSWPLGALQRTLLWAPGSSLPAPVLLTVEKPNSACLSLHVRKWRSAYEILTYGFLKISSLRSFKMWSNIVEGNQHNIINMNILWSCQSVCVVTMLTRCNDGEKRERKKKLRCFLLPLKKWHYPVCKTPRAEFKP